MIHSRSWVLVAILALIFLSSISVAVWYGHRHLKRENNEEENFFSHAVDYSYTINQAEALCDLIQSSTISKVSGRWSCKNPYPCVSPRWHGISCHGHYVITIELEDMKIAGSLPPSISKLSKLQSLNIHGNDFFGVLPTSIGEMTNLEELVFSKNKFDGFIPTSIGLLKELHYLDLSDNKLSGIIPSELCQLPKLESNFNGNKFICYSDCLSTIHHPIHANLPSCSSRGFPFSPTNSPSYTPTVSPSTSMLLTETPTSALTNVPTGSSTKSMETVMQTHIPSGAFSSYDFSMEVVNRA